MRRRSKKPFVNIGPRGRDFPTYRELRKHIPELLREQQTWHNRYPYDFAATITVTRTRRGEWGQWFEIWADAANPEIIDEGWY